MLSLCIVCWGDHSKKTKKARKQIEMKKMKQTSQWNICKTHWYMQNLCFLSHSKVTSKQQIIEEPQSLWTSSSQNLSHGPVVGEVWSENCIFRKAPRFDKWHTEKSYAKQANQAQLWVAVQGSKESKTSSFWQSGSCNSGSLRLLPIPLLRPSEQRGWCSEYVLLGRNVLPSTSLCQPCPHSCSNCCTVVAKVGSAVCHPAAIHYNVWKLKKYCRACLLLHWK